jgi:hypothetical protein
LYIIYIILFGFKFRRSYPYPWWIWRYFDKYPALVYYSAGAAAAAAAAAEFSPRYYMGNLLQHKLIRVQCTKKSTRILVSPVPQYGYEFLLYSRKVIFETYNPSQPARVTDKRNPPALQGYYYYYHFVDMLYRL